MNMVLIFSANFGMGFSASRPCRVSSFNQFEYVGHPAPVRVLTRLWSGPGLWCVGPCECSPPLWPADYGLPFGRLRDGLQPVAPVSCVQF